MGETSFISAFVKHADQHISPFLHHCVANTTNQFKKKKGQIHRQQKWLVDHVLQPYQNSEYGWVLFKMCYLQTYEPRYMLQQTLWHHIDVKLVRKKNKLMILLTFQTVSWMCSCVDKPWDQSERFFGHGGSSPPPGFAWWTGWPLPHSETLSAPGSQTAHLQRPCNTDTSHPAPALQYFGYCPPSIYDDNLIAVCTSVAKRIFHSYALYMVESRVNT